ncbi:hypothetical protein AB0H71_33195 [Nocardia sp. NPDC050697]|uniref:hypothetical protein n=1 Tax=Nocardia sp. NPDC050697 TaxID=3155158 RepID=UPI0033F3222A
MAIEIPDEVARFLAAIGVPHPDIDEDDVRALAGYVRELAAGLRAAPGAPPDPDPAAGCAAEALLRSLAATGAAHREQLDTGCRIFAAALDGAADVLAAVHAAGWGSNVGRAPGRAGVVDGVPGEPGRASAGDRVPSGELGRVGDADRAPGGEPGKAGDERPAARKPAPETKRPAHTPWRRPAAKAETPTAAPRPRTPWRNHRAANITVPTIRHPRDENGTHP